MAGSRESTREKRVAATVAEILRSDERLSNWKSYPFVIGKGPSQSTMFDSLKPYPNNQQIFVWFAVMGIEDEQTTTEIVEALKDEKNLSHLKSRIVSLYFLGKTTRENCTEGRWLFVAELRDAAHKGQIMIGIYHTGYRTGGALFVD